MVVVLKLEVFSYALAHSKRKYYQAYESYDVHALMAGHVEAFERFGGAAKRCKYDGQKAVVIRWEGFLVGREFRDLDDFRAQLRAWLDGTVDQRRRHGRSALERFAEEAPHLVALPRHPYDTARVVYRVCSIDGFVEYGGNRYAIPYDHVTDILPLRITQNELFVYAADFECIARHELGERGRHQEIDPNGLHRRRLRRPAIDLDQLKKTYEGMGEGAADFLRLLSRGSR